jgi:exopolysaccharide production protein ExoQ
MTSILDPSIRRVSSTTGHWYYFVVAFFILQSSGAFSVIDRLKYGEWFGKTSDQFMQSLNLLQIVVSIFLFWIGYRRSKSIGLGGTLLLAVVTFLIFSTLWSVDLEASLRRSFEYLFFALAVIGIANSLGGNEYMQVMRWTVFLSAIASLVLLVISPANVLMEDGAMRGVFTHKNVLGQFMAAGVLASLHGIRVRGGHRRSCAAMIIVFVGLAFAARSTTALMTIFVFCAAEMSIALSRRNGAGGGLMVSIISMPVLATFILSPDVFLGFLGKDATLTGRTDLWEFVKICISQRPLLGWGFNAFWLPTNPAAVEISTNLGWAVPEAHNGLLELLLEVGGVGTSLFAIVFIRNIWIAARCLRTPAKVLGASLLLCCGGILLVGVSEEVLVDPSQISVGMFFVLGLTVERILRGEARLKHFRPVTPPLQSVLARGPDL